MRFLEVILKTVETCNINCKYCYFFVDTALEERRVSKINKKIISVDQINNLISFLKTGIQALSIELVKIVFHGGEPLLQNRGDFDRMCLLLIDGLSPHVRLQLSIQTNAVCINVQWLELFKKHKVTLGISLDGPAKYNDIQRVDFSGKGTHSRVVKAIKKAQEYVSNNELKEIGLISVVDARYSAKEIFYHFVKELNIKSMNFLLPDYNNDTYKEHFNDTGSKVSDYGKFMCDLFDAWFDNDDETVDIVFLKQIIKLLMGSKHILMVDTGPLSNEEELPILTVYHDGNISPDDTYMTSDKTINSKRKNLVNSTLVEFTRSEEVIKIKSIRKTPPKPCLECRWLKICNGGASINRYSKANEFDNPSVYCEALKMIYEHITKRLISHGVSQSIINEQLNENVA